MTVLMLTGAFLTVSADADAYELVDAMIYAEREYFDNLEKAEEYLSLLCPGIELTQRYPSSVFGFCARIRSELIGYIDSSEYFDAHECGYFEPMKTETEPGQGYATASAYASEMLGVSVAHDSGYSGKGIVVAVIDNGFDINHEAFANAPDKYALTQKAVEGLAADRMLNVNPLFAQRLYVSEKIPFAYNYSAASTDVSTLDSHGTHVSAIIAGDCDALTGVAPDAQLLLMKVFDQRTSNAPEQYVVSALEDAISLGADVINLSIGSYSGSTYAGKGSSIDRMAKYLTQAGIVVVCAAGNDATMGKTSTFARHLQLEYPLASTPDYGTVNHPSVTDEYISVASAQNTHVAYDALIHEDEYKNVRRIRYIDTNSSQGIIRTTFLKHFDKSELEYVPVPGLGESVDYDRIDVKGKIALIQRGVTMFSEKVKAAAAAGAVGAVVYNNVDGEDVYMELDGCSIPAVFISKEDGEYLLNATKKVLVFDSAMSELVENEKAYTMSAFSSWGVTPEFELKPEITGVGESVYSAAVGGTYTSLSGTSMATPFISGISALLCEKLDLDRKALSVSERPAYIKSILMNSAHPLSDAVAGTEFSPRQQGAGLADANRAVNTKILLSGSDGKSSAKAQRLGRGSYLLSFTAENISDEPLDTEIEISLSCDKSLSMVITVNGEEQMYTFNALKPRALMGTVRDISDTENAPMIEDKRLHLKLEPGQEVSYELEITLDESELEKNRVFENGYFVDGYIYARTSESESSIPFVGFSDAFMDTDIFDLTVYEGRLPFFTGNALASQDARGQYYVLGSPDGTANAAKEELVAFSPNGDGVFDTLSFSPSLLRNVSGLRLDITSADGDSVFADSFTKNALTKGGGERNSPILLWNGSDGLYADYIFPDGKYLAKIDAYTGGSKSGQSLSIEFVIDTQRPECWVDDWRDNNGVKTLTIALKDNHAVKNVVFYDDLGEPIRLATSDTLRGPGEVSRLAYDVSDIKTKHVWADVTDYAMNTKTVKIRIP